MVTIGPYPTEASFFPEHLVIASLTLLIFLILLFVLASIRKAHGDATFKITDFGASEVIALLGVIIAIVSAFVVPFTQLPIIDYSVTADPPSVGEQGGGNQIINIKLHVYGVVAAKNIIVSMTASNSQFGIPTSTPFLAKHLTYSISNSTTADIGQIGKALLEIDALPARSATTITIPVASKSPSSQLEPELITYLRSDAAVGYHQTTDLFLFYSILSAFYLGIALILVAKKLNLLITSKGIDILHIALLGLLLAIVIGLAYAILLA